MVLNGLGLAAGHPGLYPPVSSLLMTFTEEDPGGTFFTQGRSERRVWSSIYLLLAARVRPNRKVKENTGFLPITSSIATDEKKDKNEYWHKRQKRVTLIFTYTCRRSSGLVPTCSPVDNQINAFLLHNKRPPRLLSSSTSFEGPLFRTRKKRLMRWPFI